jgi:hypothetical protein
MSDKKNIDRLFQESFKNFEATPSDAVWTHIEAQLQQKNKKRRAIPIWWRYAGAAAVLLLLLTIGNSFFGEPTEAIPPTNVVETEYTTRSNSSENETFESESTNGVATDASKNTDDIIVKTKNASDGKTPSSKASTLAETSSENNESENISNTPLKKTSNNALINSENRAASTNSYNEKSDNLKNSESKTNYKSNPILVNKTAKNIAIVENSGKENNDNPLSKQPALDATKADAVVNNTEKSNAVLADSKSEESKVENKTPTIEDILEESKDIIEEEERLNRWSVTPNAAPVYFNTLRDGSSIDGQFNNNSKTGETNMSYGISASYAVNKKLHIRSGINKVNLGYNTNNVVVYETLSKSSGSSLLSNVSVAKTTSANTTTTNNIALVSAENFESNKAESLVSNSNTSINQSFVYIEVPLEIQYTLSDKKLGINVIGGFSSFFLSDNELFSDVEGNRTSIGEATNINNMSYSANLGLGFQYKFTKKLNLNLEPMFKYQINTFNNTSGNFTPYFIGVYTGIGFKF